jgi:FkbM family methyltransferase
MAPPAEDPPTSAEDSKAAKARARAEVSQRLDFVDLAADLTPYIAVTSGAATYIVGTSGDHISRDLFAKQARKEMRVLDKALAVLDAGARPERGVFVDAGAHIGTTSIHALMEHAFARAVCLEPDEEHLRLLRINSLMNGLDERLRVVEAAASDREGFAELDLAPSSSAQRALLRAGADPSGQTRAVRTTTLDALCADGIIEPAEVSVLWMDVEGHEGHVLAGARGLLERRVPAVLEFCPRLLADAGGLETLSRVVNETYTHVLDLKLRWTDEPPLVPVAEVAALADTYGREGARPEFTDLLFVALD